jgi:hypothetical protein
MPPGRSSRRYVLTLQPDVRDMALILRGLPNSCQGIVGDPGYGAGAGFAGNALLISAYGGAVCVGRNKPAGRAKRHAGVSGGTAGDQLRPPIPPRRCGLSRVVFVVINPDTGWDAGAGIAGNALLIPAYGWAAYVGRNKPASRAKRRRCFRQRCAAFLLNPLA